MVTPHTASSSSPARNCSKVRLIPKYQHHQHHQQQQHHHHHNYKQPLHVSIVLLLSLLGWAAYYHHSRLLSDMSRWNGISNSDGSSSSKSSSSLDSRSLWKDSKGGSADEHVDNNHDMDNNTKNKSQTAVVVAVPVATQLGTVIFLAPQRNAGSFWDVDRFCLFLRAIRSVDQHLNQVYGPYPIHVLLAKDYQLDPQGQDGPYTDEDRALIRQWAPHSTIHFIEINMYSDDAFEPNMTMQQAVEWKAAMPPRFHHGVGYASMCRLWSGRLQHMEFLQPYQYYMRMDDDSLLVKNVEFDPFVKMKEGQYLYAYRRLAHDSWGVPELWASVRPLINITEETIFVNTGKPMIKPFLSPKAAAAAVAAVVATTAAAPASNQSRERFPDAQYKGVQPYNNFHVTAVSFWSSPEWMEVWNTVNRDHLFFQHRVGDANVHAIACMLMKRRQITDWYAFPYRHNSNDMGDHWVKPEWRSECQNAYSTFLPKRQAQQQQQNQHQQGKNVSSTAQ